MYKLYKGDCLEVMKKIPDSSVDMILCDLPYGTTNCRWDSVIPFDDLWAQYNRVTKENAAIVLFAAQPFTTKLIHSNLKDFKYNWYWIKRNATGHCFSKFQPMRKVEDICVFYKKQPVYNPQGLTKLEKPIIKIKKAKVDSVYKIDASENISKTEYTNYPKNIIEFKHDKDKFHPTQKPVQLLEYLIKTYTNENETVLDNCMGSGSTGAACINTNRNFIGIELDDGYFKIATERIGNTLAELDNKAA